MPATHSIDKNYEFARCLSATKSRRWRRFTGSRWPLKTRRQCAHLSLVYGLVFTLIPACIMWFVYQSGTHLVILPAAVAFALIGPAFAAGLYDVAWELEKAINQHLLTV